MKFKSIFVAAIAALFIVSCTETDDQDVNVWDKYADWREENTTWIEQQEALLDEAGNPVYTKVVPEWNRNGYVLMRWFNDRALTENNLVPLYTSTVDVKYYGRLYTDEPFDSSYTSISPADSVSRFQISKTIQGWAIALEQMHVGDSVEVIIPYELAYGASAPSDKILPYSALKFNIKLTNIAGEYIRPLN